MLIKKLYFLLFPVKTYRSCALLSSLTAYLGLVSIIIQYFSVLGPRNVFKVYMREYRDNIPTYVIGTIFRLHNHRTESLVKSV